MKKYILLGLLLSSILSLQVYAEKPRRFVEFGLDVGVGLANNLTGVRDIMKKNILLDLNALSDQIKSDGVSVNTDIDSAVFFKFNAGEKWGFGISSGVEGAINGTIPKSLFTLITEGNINHHVLEGDFTVFGSIFADIAIEAHAQIGKRLRVGITPAMYVPLIYIPKSSIGYGLYTEDSLAAKVTGEIKVYSPFSLEQIREGESSDYSKAIEGKGFDLSLHGEYALFPILDVGGTVSHIPLSGAVLSNQMTVSMKDFKIDGSKLLTDQNLEIPDLEIQEEYTTASYRVFRPLRFDVYGLYRPFKVNFFTLRPNIGFTHVIGEGIPPYFNAGLELRLSVLRLLFFHLGTGYEEAIWRHRVGLALNLRILELDVEAGLRSQDFEKSFNMQGFNLAVGVRFGF